jgi:hypothetical protein
LGHLRRVFLGQTAAFGVWFAGVWFAGLWFVEAGVEARVVAPDWTGELFFVPLHDELGVAALVHVDVEQTLGRLFVHDDCTVGAGLPVFAETDALVVADLVVVGILDLHQQTREGASGHVPFQVGQAVVLAKQFDAPFLAPVGAAEADVVDAAAAQLLVPVFSVLELPQVIDDPEVRFVFGAAQLTHDCIGQHIVVVFWVWRAPALFLLLAQCLDDGARA